MSTPHPLSVWAQNVSPSPTLEIDAKAKAMMAAGDDVCSFAAGEPDFDTPDFIKDAAIAALKAGKTKYAPTPGVQELRVAIAARYGTEFGYQVKPAQVVVSPGGKFSCFIGLQTVCNPGDDILVPAPYWVSYPEMVKLCGGRPVFVATDDTTAFKMTPAMVEQAVTPKTKAVIFNNPSNPTGAVYTRAEIEALVAVFLKHNLYILSDEMYEHLIYDGGSPTCVATLSAEAAAHTITASGFSKSYAMTGWRLGTLVARPDIAKAAGELQAQMSSNATTFGQYGALAALVESDKAKVTLAAMKIAFDRRRRLMHAGLEKIPGMTCILASGAFYLFPNISRFGLPSVKFAARLLAEEKVATVPGLAFGAEGYLRLSYATSDETITRGLARLARFCATLAK